MSALRAPKRSRVSTGRRTERTPSVDAVGRVVAMARCGVFHPSVAAAIEVTLLTAQRRFSVVQARRSMLVEEDGRRVWRLPLEDLKTGDRRVGRRGETIPDHEVPLTPATLAAFETRLSVETTTDWLFPQVRPRRRGDPVSHLHESSLTHAVAELPTPPYPRTTSAEHSRRRSGRPASLADRHL